VLSSGAASSQLVAHRMGRLSVLAKHREPIPSWMPELVEVLELTQVSMLMKVSELTQVREQVVAC
jgi:hypothetical protein